MPAHWRIISAMNRSTSTSMTGKTVRRSQQRPLVGSLLPQDGPCSKQDVLLYLCSSLKTSHTKWHPSQMAKEVVPSVIRFDWIPLLFYCQLRSVFFAAFHGLLIYQKTFYNRYHCIKKEYRCPYSSSRRLWRRLRSQSSLLCLLRSLRFLRKGG